jgi:exosome complex exonuclease DIS3/RRP44
MLKLKTFVRKTRRGKILKVVREHYLRDDLACGIAGCNLCQKNASEDGDESAISPILDKNPASVCDLYPKDHYVVLVS